MRRNLVSNQKGRHMSLRTMLITFVGAVIVSGVAACGTPSTPQPSPSAVATTSAELPPAGPESRCAELGGTVDPNYICHVLTTTPTYRVTMSYPIDYPDYGAVADAVTQERDGFIDWVRDFGAHSRRGRPYELDVTATTYHAGPAGAGTETLVLKVDNDTGLAHEAHPDTSFHAFNYDYAKHTAITFDTLFKPDAKPLEVLNPIVQRELGAAADTLEPRVYTNFALTDDAVIFFFGEGQVIPDNSGPRKLSIPRAELASILA
jgi:hypothetical protein